MLSSQKTLQRRILLGLLSTMSLSFISACSGSGGGGASGAGAAGTNGAQSMSELSLALAKFPRAATVCDPLNGSPSVNIVGESFGLSGQLYVLPASLDGKLTGVNDYITQGISTGTNVFLNSVNVPTRDFTEGFPVADGSLVSYQGTPLLEWFAIDLKSAVQLAPGNTPGDYQIALLADDGAILYTYNAQTNSMDEFLNNDGLHPTTMACATKPFTLNASQQIPIELKYYQGPRTQIALQMMWRPFPKNSAQVADPLCGASGNYEFFNPDVAPSAPQKNYTDLLSRGWAPLAPQNFVIPGGMNPCNVPNFQLAQ